jgi:hypothetical protein
MLKEYANKISGPANMIGNYYCIVIFHKMVDDDGEQDDRYELWAVPSREKLELAVNHLTGMQFAVIRAKSLTCKMVVEELEEC